MEFLSDRELASKTDEEIKEYVHCLIKESARLRYSVLTPTSKFWKRVKDYREGKDADLTHPKRRDIYTYQYEGREKVVKKRCQDSCGPSPLVRSPKLEAPSPSEEVVKSKRPAASSKKGRVGGVGGVGGVKKVVLEVGSKSEE